MNSDKRILIIPSIKRGNGSGHLRRSIKLASELSLKGSEAAVFIPLMTNQNESFYSRSDIDKLLNSDLSGTKFLTEV
ncbi:MAG: hypothetical protein PQJ46_13200, partial [Spirochaetales bacterium]|nr:hypothetical protein [Spirochaetales bacterium]